MAPVTYGNSAYGKSCLELCPFPPVSICVCDVGDVIISKTLSKHRLKKEVTRNPLLSLYSKAVHSHETVSILFVILFVGLTSIICSFNRSRLRFSHRIP